MLRLSVALHRGGVEELRRRSLADDLSDGVSSLVALKTETLAMRCQVWCRYQSRRDLSRASPWPIQNHQICDMIYVICRFDMVSTNFKFLKKW